jgi:tripeptidyl-peptidase I
VFHPDFPAASPYVTAVGGTNFAEQSTIGEEVVWSGSGGGFSDTFSVPSYQAEAVAAYKASADNMPPQSYWNSSGRGYPDISALAGLVNPYCVAFGGSAVRYGGVGGTSAASPVSAGVFAQLNNLLLAAGKPQLGFLNPFIYQVRQRAVPLAPRKLPGGRRLRGVCPYRGRTWTPSTT